MTGDDRPRPETLAAQALGLIEPTTRAIVPPIHLATTFERGADLGYPGGVSYARSEGAFATRQAEDVLNALEGGSGATLFSSGMAAVAGAFGLLTRGDHVVVQRPCYYGVARWLEGPGAALGLAATTVAHDDLAAFAAAIVPGRTKLVWIESPANPTWTVTDIAAVASLAHDGGALLAVDSTVATPALTRPFEHGADLVMHSATKYLNGHSDVLAGALVAAPGRDDLRARIAALRSENGAVLGPFEAWLLLRGMRTLFVRVRAASASALAIARRFAGDARLAAVLYPGLPSHPGHAIAERQMKGGFGGMLSIRVKGGREAAVAAAARMRVFKRATSLGGVESLVEHRASIERGPTGVPEDLLRLSIGLEHSDDLVADLDQALG
jgi:cystathionine gamma-synthase